MAFINGRMEIAMRAAGSTASNMERALTFLPMEMFILVITPSARPMAKASINGKTEAFTKVNSKKE